MSIFPVTCTQSCWSVWVGVRHSIRQRTAFCENYAKIRKLHKLRKLRKLRKLHKLHKSCVSCVIHVAQITQLTQITQKLRKLHKLCKSCVSCVICVILRNLRKMQFIAYVWSDRPYSGLRMPNVLHFVLRGPAGLNIVIPHHHRNP